MPVPPAQPHEQPTGPSGDPVLLRRGNLVVTRTRLLQAGGVLVLLLLGAVLPYVSLPYLNGASEPVTGRPRLFGAAQLLGGLDPTYLPGYAPPRRSDYDLALNFAAAGPGLQQIGTVVAALTCWALVTEEINRFAWWFFHLAGYPLVLAPVALLVGDVLLHRLDVAAGVGPAWVASLLAGALVLVASWRARPRIDSYSAF